MNKGRWLGILMAAAMACALLPATALAQGVTCPDGADCTAHAAEVGGMHYDTLQEAIAEANGARITLLKDETVSSDIILNKSMALDLGGHKLTLAKNVKIQITGDDSVLDLRNGTLEGNRTLLILCYQGATTNLTGITGVNHRAEGTGSTEYSNFLQLGSNVDYSTGHGRIEGCNLTAGGNVEYILGKRASDSSDPSTCTIVNSSMTGRNPISGNGNCYADVKIESGTFTGQWNLSGNTAAVYWPGAGKLTIQGGTFTGGTAVYAKSGEIEIAGGTFTGTADRDYAHSGSGFIATGDAIVLDGCNYPGGSPQAQIQDGTFVSKNRDAVNAYTSQGATVDSEEMIAGGVFSSDVAKFADASATRASRLAANGVSTYYVGTETTVAQRVGNAAQTGDTISVQSGDLALTDLPDGVKVQNAGSGNVTANGETVTGQPVVTHTHVWGAPTWTWQDGYGEATARFVCTADASHTQTLTATATADETPATCAQAGKTVFTVRVTLDGRAYTDTRTVEIPKTQAHHFVDGVCTVCGVTQTVQPTPDATPVPTPVATPAPTADADVPKTGQSGHGLWWGLLAVLAAAGLAGVALYGKRRTVR